MGFDQAVLRSSGVFGGGGYTSKVLFLRRSALIAYWPLDEAGGKTAYDASGHAYHGTNTGATVGAGGMGDGGTAYSFDGVDNRINVYSVPFRAAFNGAAGTLALWAKVASAGAWTDADFHVCIELLVNGSNFVYIRKNDTNNQLSWAYMAGASFLNPTKSASVTTPIHLALTWDKAADAVIAYYNGAQEGATLTGLGTWAGVLAPTSSVIGADDSTGSLAWLGTLAHVGLWNVALTAAEIATMATIP